MPYVWQNGNEIEPDMSRRADANPLKEILKIIVNTWGPCDLYPDDVVTKWIEKNVMDPNGGWFEMVEEKVSEAINNAAPGDAIHDVLTSWAEANNYVKSKIPLDERRYG
jgi:hypothetical protein